MINDSSSELSHELSELLIKPFDLSGFYMKRFVVELTSREQLKEEGQSWIQYEDWIKRRGWRLFHLEYYGVSSTLLTTDYGTCLEHLGRFNKSLKKKNIILAINKKHIELAEQLSDYILRKYSNIDEYMQSLVDYVSLIECEDKNYDNICQYGEFCE